MLYITFLCVLKIELSKQNKTTKKNLIPPNWILKRKKTKISPIKSNKMNMNNTFLNNLWIKEETKRLKRLVDMAIAEAKADFELFEKWKGFLEEYKIIIDSFSDSLDDDWEDILKLYNNILELFHRLKCKNQSLFFF